MIHADVELPSNKKFGLFFAAVFLLLSAYFVSESRYVLACIFIVLAISFVLLSFTKSEVLLPFNKIWMRFGLLLGMVVSPIVLGVIFFVIFTPIGFVMRLYGRDELNLNTKTAVTFWKARDPAELSAVSFKNQF